MPSHPDRVRTAPLPEGYQFGDAGREWRRVNRIMSKHDVAGMFNPWRAPHLNAAEQLARKAGWNVIEGEH